MYQKYLLLCKADSGGTRRRLEGCEALHRVGRSAMLYVQRSKDQQPTKRPAGETVGLVWKTQLNRRRLDCTSRSPKYANIEKILKFLSRRPHQIGEDVAVLSREIVPTG